MSIASEIERLQNAKTSIKTAIENKGVEVGNGTIDTYASKIDGMTVLNSKITHMQYLFINDRFGNDFNTVLSLIENITRMDYAFASCTMTELDLSHIDMSECTQWSNAFANCYYLKKIKFNEKEIAEFTSATSMFANCEELDDLDMSNFDFGKVTQLQSMFAYTHGLKNFMSFKNLGKAYTQKAKNYYAYNLNFNNATNLTHDSLMSIINNLYDLNLSYDVANGGTLYTQSLTLGSSNKAKLTSAEIKIATDKGWTVS